MQSDENGGRDHSQLINPRSSSLVTQVNLGKRLDRFPRSLGVRLVPDWHRNKDGQLNPSFTERRQLLATACRRTNEGEFLSHFVSHSLGIPCSQSGSFLLKPTVLKQFVVEREPTVGREVPPSRLFRRIQIV